MIGHNSNAGTELRKYIDRIERLREEKAALSEDEREVFAEAKANGFDAKIMRQVLKIKQKGVEDHEEERTLVDMYLTALKMI